MVKVIIGKKGSGKTKALIDSVNAEVKADKCVVCIEMGNKLNFEIDHGCRLIDISEYLVEGYQGLIGFVAGLMAANYDISDIFIDSILKMCGLNFPALGEFLAKLDELNKERKVQFTITVSADESEVPESVSKYVVH